MIKSRYFALIFRSVAFLTCLFGILWRTGIFRGEFNGVIFGFFTLQTNVAVTVLLGILIVKTAIALKEDDKCGCNGFNPRISAAVLTAIIFVLLGFWLVFAPAGAREIPEKTYLLGTFDNLSVHLIAPLLMLGDYIMFSKGGEIRSKDPLIFLIIPVVYTIAVMVLGATRTVQFYTPGLDIEPSYYPYFFLDFSVIGFLMIPFILVMTVFYFGLGATLRYIDKMRGKRREEDEEKFDEKKQT